MLGLRRHDPSQSTQAVKVSSVHDKLSFYILAAYQLSLCTLIAGIFNHWIFAPLTRSLVPIWGAPNFGNQRKRRPPTDWHVPIGAFEKLFIVSSGYVQSSAAIPCTVSVDCAWSLRFMTNCLVCLLQRAAYQLSAFQL
jgi:hypothetical protein